MLSKFILNAESSTFSKLQRLVKQYANDTYITKPKTCFVTCILLQR